MLNNRTTWTLSSFIAINATLLHWLINPSRIDRAAQLMLGKRSLRERVAGMLRQVRRFVLLVALVPFFYPQLVPAIAPDVTGFLAGLIALIPITLLIESAVEEVAELLGQVLGGFLHVIFSNASDLALTVALLATAASATVVSQARRGEMVEIVLYYIAGIILCQTLLFPGLAMFLGNLRNGRMRFNSEQAASYAGIMGISIAILLLPSLAYKFATGVGSLRAASLALITPANLALLSDITAVLLFVIYALYIASAVFRLDFAEARLRRQRKRAARQLEMDGNAEEVSTNPPVPEAIPDATALFAEERAEAEARLFEAIPVSREPRTIRPEERRRERESRGARRYGSLTLRGLTALLVLALCTVALVIVAEGLARGVANGVLSDLHLNPLFAGLIVFPLAVNLIEAYGAVGMAWRNRMEITFAVTAGSTISWVLLGVPALVLISHVLGLGALPLLFGFFLVATLGIALYLFTVSALSGETDYVSGLQMMLFFAAVAVIAFVTSVVAQ